MENKVFEINNNESLIFKNDNNEKKLLPFVEEYLDFVKYVNEQDKSFRKRLEKEMIENGLYSEKIGKYNISIAFPKATENLDEEKLITNEDDSTLLPFIIMNKNDEFDINGLKEKYPDIYKEFYKQKVELIIDSEKLKKMRTDLFDKYKIITPPSKEPYIVIKESKK